MSRPNSLARVLPRTGSAQILLGLGLLGLASGGLFLFRYAARLANERVAWQWINGGRADRAAAYVNRALARYPDASSTWTLASALAWRMKLTALAEEDARKAAQLGGMRPELLLDWAAAALQRGNLAGAREALEHFPDSYAATSSRAERTLGHFYRQSGDSERALGCFKQALALDTGTGGAAIALDRFDLGSALLRSGDLSKMAQGRTLLEAVLNDHMLGMETTRILLADAIARKDAPAITRLLPRLGANPSFGSEDYALSCQAIILTANESFGERMAPLERQAEDNPKRIMALMGTLNQFGKAQETLRWAERLPADITHREPVCVGIAEAYRLAGQWDLLLCWAAASHWEDDFGFLPAVYAVLAARGTGHPLPTDALLATIEPRLEKNDRTFTLAATCLYNWGATHEAIAILEKGSRARELAYSSLLTLAHLYHSEHDALGAYRVSERLFTITPGNRDFANDYVYFAALLGDAGVPRVQKLALDNCDAQPDNRFYRSTCAFVLAAAGKPAEALRIISPVATEWKESRAVAWGYAAALAKSGETTRSRLVASALDRRSLSREEQAWMDTFTR